MKMFSFSQQRFTRWEVAVALPTSALWLVQSAQLSQLYTSFKLLYESKLFTCLVLSLKLRDTSTEPAEFKQGSVSAAISKVQNSKTASFKYSFPTRQALQIWLYTQALTYIYIYI